MTPTRHVKDFRIWVLILLRNQRMFNPTCSKPRLHSSQLSFLSRGVSRHRHCSFPQLHRAQHATISCSVAPNEVQVPTVKTQDPKSKSECYGVFCLTYDLRAGPFINGKEISAADLSLGPKLYHLEIALGHYKKWTVPDSLAALKSYTKYIDTVAV